MDFTPLGWIYIGLSIGFLLGAFVSGLLGSSKMGDLEAENIHLKFVRDSLKEEIFRLENQSKPKPRKKRGTVKK